jgi:hypothetical protein
MLGMFEDVNVQKEPARPVYCEHSFVTFRAPLRGVADANGAATATATTTANPKINLFICSPLLAGHTGGGPERTLEAAPSSF